MEAEQYTLDAGHSFNTDVSVDANANLPGTPANAIVGFCMNEVTDKRSIHTPV